MTKLLILGLAGVAGIAATVVDHENLLGNNPLKQWWWERVFPQPETQGLSIIQKSQVRHMIRAAEPEQPKPLSKYMVTAPTNYQEPRVYHPKSLS